MSTCVSSIGGCVYREPACMAPGLYTQTLAAACLSSKHAANARSRYAFSKGECIRECIPIDVHIAASPSLLAPIEGGEFEK